MSKLGAWEWLQTNRLSSPQTTGPVTTDYEIFSTVLGTSLSQVVFESGSEVSRKTSVYAGGAVIAEQRRLLDTDTIVYMHADPVTGSKQEVSQSGQPFSGLRARVEYEPLGQRVRINPPFEEPPPPSVPPAATGDAKFMEWQCTNSQRLGHSFRELPMHCKQALLENVALSRGDIFGTPKEGNPGRISEKNGVPPELKLSDKRKKAANKALAATEKFAEGDNETVIGYGVPTVPGFVDANENGSVDHNSDFIQGLKVARKALLSDKCANLFLQKGFDPIESLDKYLFNRLITIGNADARGSKFKSSNVGAATSPGTASYLNANGVRVSAARIVINSGGFFFSGLTDDGKFVGNVSSTGFVGLSMPEIRGSVIIHELLHALGLIRHDGEDLKDNGRQSRANSELVRKSCF